MPHGRRATASRLVRAGALVYNCGHVGHSSPRRRSLGLLLAAAMLAALPAPLGADVPPPDASDPLYGDPDALPPAYPDPLEPLNRGIFAFNRQVDRWVITPITNVYVRVVPGIARRSVRRFFTNLNSPSVIANDVLQCQWTDSGVSTARLAINSTIGIAGLADPATRLGLPLHHSDFGQTLALRGVPSGPYLVMPLLGPTTFRDGFGVLVDFAFRPTTYLLGSVVLAELAGLPGTAGIGDQLIYGTIQGGGTGFVEREAHAEQLDALEESSIDFYATMRSAYYQNRQAAIWSRHEARRGVTAPRYLSARPCRLGAPRSFPAGKFPVPRIRRVRSPQCSPSA